MLRILYAAAAALAAAMMQPVHAQSVTAVQVDETTVRLDLAPQYECRVRERGRSGWGAWSAWAACPSGMEFSGLTTGNFYRFGVRMPATTSEVVALVGPPPPPPPPPPTTCVTPPHTPGGPDGMGGCWPGPGNTGVPVGTQLANYTGPNTITADNTVIDGKIVTGDLVIRGKNVVIRNSKLNSRNINTQSGGDVTIVDSEVDFGDIRGDGICCGNFALFRVHMHGGRRHVWCEHGCIVEDSYAFNQATPQNSEHLSSFRMGQHTVLRHNAFGCNAPVVGGGGCSGDLTGYPDFQPIHSNTIERNLFLSTITASFCAYGGSTSGKPYSNHADQGKNIVFRDNVFQRGSNNKCAFYGPITDFRPGAVGARWENNTWDDGATLPPG